MQQQQNRMMAKTHTMNCKEQEQWNVERVWKQKKKQQLNHKLNETSISSLYEMY